MIASESPDEDNFELSRLCTAAGCVYNVTVGLDDQALANDSRYERVVCVLDAAPEDFLASRTFQTFIYIMYSAVFLVALVGNGLVCFVVHKTQRMKTVTNYFIVNLAVGDILMTLFCVPFSFVSTLVLRYWPFGGTMCKVVNCVQAVSVFVSAYTLLAISIDRYMAIMRPLQPRLGRLGAKLTVAAVWGGAIATAAPIPVVSRLHRPSPWHVACQVDICGEVWADARQSARYTLALLALQFALPLSVLACTYARIAAAVCAVRPPGEAQRARDSRLLRSKRKMVKMMVTVVAVFIICWLPLNIFILLWTIHEEDDSWGEWPGMPYVWFASHWLAMSHSCYNPVIYCYMNARYRRGFKQIFGTVACFKKKDENSCHRPDVCEGVPLTDFAGYSSARRRVVGCKCRLSREPANGTNTVSVLCITCSSLRQSRKGLLVVQGPQAAPALSPVLPVRALSVRSEFT